MPGDRGDWWDECVVAAATSKHKRGAFNLICKSQGESEWKEHGECITLEDVYLNRSEYGMGKEWVLLQGEAERVCPEGWSLVPKPRGLTHDFFKGIVDTQKSTVQLMYKWRAPVDWEVGAFRKANKSNIARSYHVATPAGWKDGHVVVHYDTSGLESRHYLEGSAYGTQWVLIRKDGQ